MPIYIIFLHSIQYTLTDDENNKGDKPYIWVIVAILAVSSAILLTILLVK